MVTIGINASQLEVREKSGIEFTVESLVEEFVRVTKSQGSRLRLYVPKPLKRAYPSHVEICVLKWPFSFLWTQLRLGLELVVHPPTAFLDISNFLPVLGLCSRSRQYFFAHDYSFITFPMRYRFSRLLLMHVGNVVSCLRANAIFTPTEATTKQIETFFPYWKHKARTVGLGMNQGLLDGLNHTTEPTSIPSGKPYFMFVGRIGGRIDGRKNLDQLIIGFHQWNSSHGSTHRLVLCGRDDGDKKWLEELAGSIGCRDVVFTGFVSNQELANLFTHCDGVTHTTYGEGFGVPIIEGLTAGKRVLVTTQTGGISGMVADHLTFCEPDAKGIAKGIADLVASQPPSPLKWKSYHDVVQTMYDIMI